MKPYSTEQWLSRLVACPTVSRDSNLELIRLVADDLDFAGAQVSLIHNDEKTKANLLARVGPEAEGGVVLSGHTDVVPVDGQPWSRDPFSVWSQDGRLYGRGVCDMKGFIASALSTRPSNPESLRRPLWLAFSYDEEVGCVGAPSMIARLTEYSSMRPMGVIVGEPTSLRSISGHKGIAAARTHVKGYETHSSQLHRGVSAVMVAARLITKLEAMNVKLKEVNTDKRFTPDYTTIHVGTMTGGTAINITAGDASFVWDIRTIPGDSAREIIDEFIRFCDTDVLPEMKQKHSGCHITTEVLADAPGLNAPLSAPMRYLNKLAEVPLSEECVPYATEAGQFQAAGFDSVIWGPGSIDQAHQVDEWIEQSDLESCDRALHRIAHSLTKEELE